MRDEVEDTREKEKEIRIFGRKKRKRCESERYEVYGFIFHQNDLWKSKYIYYCIPAIYIWSLKTLVTTKYVTNSILTVTNKRWSLKIGD